MKRTPKTRFATRLSGSTKEAELRIRSILQWKKKRPPVILFALLVILVLLCFGLVSCELGRGGADLEEQKTQTMNQFLTEFFQFNNQNRYEKNLEAVQGMDDLEAMEAAIQEYYQPFLSIVTENCLDLMQANRMPFKYDAIAASQGITPQIQNIQYEPVDETSYAFEITYKEGGISDIFPTPIKGRISIEVAENQVRVDSITIASRPKLS